MHAKTRDDGLADFAGLQAVERIFKLGHELARAGPAQIAALGGTAVLGVLLGQLGKTGLATLNALAQFL